MELLFFIFGLGSTPNAFPLEFFHRQNATRHGFNRLNLIRLAAAAAEAERYINTHIIITTRPRSLLAVHGLHQ